MPKKKKPGCMPKTAVAYARYSSAGQRDVSIDQQLQDIRAYAKREGYVIVHEYADRAKSGFKNVAARHEFQQMLNDASSGTFDTVIAWKVDRFGRNRRESAIYKGQLSDLGVNVVYAMEPIPKGAAGVLTEGMLESIAEWYSRNLSENVVRGQMDNARRGISNGVDVLGYRRGQDGRYEINPEESQLVRHIFEMYISGYSAGSISRELNVSGVRYIHGKQFTSAIVLRIIGNEQYYGVYKWADIRLPGTVPAIITEDEWKKAQQMRKKTGRHIESATGRDDFILSGKLFCGQCGRCMVGDSGRSHTGNVYYYYTCTGHKARSGTVSTCDRKSIRKEDIEKAVLDFIYDKCLTGPEHERIADAILEAQGEFEQKSPRAAMVKNLRETEKKISNINDAIEQGIWNSTTSSRLKELEDAADSLRLSIAELDFSQSQLLDRDRIIFFLEKMANYRRDNSDRQRQLIYTFINSVFVYDDRIKIIINAVGESAPISLDTVKSSEKDFSTLPVKSHPNLFVVAYQIPFPA